MTAYTRQSTYTDGDVITAAHTNDEFDRLVTVFNNASGHKHDGTAGEGPVIGLIGDPGVATPKNKVVVDDTNNQIEVSIDVSGTSTEQFVVKDGVIEPTTTNDIDIGATAKQFKDLYLDGTATIDGLAMPTTTVTDILDEDNMSSDSATALATQQSIKAYVDSQVTAQDLDFQGDSGGALSIDLDSETLTVAGGTGIDTTGSGNTLTIDIDSTVATLTGTQTLTNKTLTAPVISTISNTGTVTLPTSTDTLVGRATTDTLTNKTLTSAVLNTAVSGTAVLDEDNMVSDSATQLATQQSIKAYVDTEVAGVNPATGNELENVVEDTTPQLGGNLDVNGNSIVSASNGDIAITPNGTGNVVIDGLNHPQADGTAGQFLKTDGAGQLAFDTVTQATGNELENVVEDTTPQLGGDLDVNGNKITSASNGDIDIEPNGTGNVLLGNYEFDVDQTVGAGQDDYVLTYDNATGHISLEAAAAGGISDVVSDTTPQLGGELDSNGNSIQMADGDTIIFGTDDDATVSYDNSDAAVEFKFGANDRISYNNNGAKLHDTNGTRVLEAGFGKVEIDGNLEMEDRGEVRFYEASAAGSDYMAFKAPNGLTTTTTFTLPNGDGTSGQALVTDGSGTLSFSTPTGDGDGLAFAIALG